MSLSVYTDRAYRAGDRGLEEPTHGGYERRSGHLPQSHRGQAVALNFTEVVMVTIDGAKVMYTISGVPVAPVRCDQTINRWVRVLLPPTF